MKQLTEKIKALAEKYPQLAELFRFAFSGGTSFVVEFIVLTLLVEVFHAPVLVATGIAFLVSVVVNYWMCVKWVFTGAQDGSAAVKASFLLTSGMGLALNMFFMWLLNEVLGVYYMIAKIISTLLVMVWNYFTKRMLLKRK